MKQLTGYYADVKNSTQLAAHRRKNGILLLPVGCFEMHGPHAGMSCDTFIAEAACAILAEAWDGLVLPPIHYTYPGASGPWPGTIDISPEATMAYLKAVVEAVFKNGFRKLVLVNIHFPNVPAIQQVVRMAFQDTGQTPLFINIDYGALNQRIAEQWGEGYGEAMIMLGALYIIGRHGQWDPGKFSKRKLPGPTWPSPAAARLAKRGVNFGYYFVKPENHVGQFPAMKLEHAPVAAAIFKKMVLSKAPGLPQDYDALLKDQSKAARKKPWRDIR